ncbi:MAG TPA: dephospho-CoA kinase [Dehalococcoidia bacterium]|nr:dephospho-CoA kinase [Dehalococcoidia bacterium]
MQKHIVAIVGMPGAGKSEVSRIFEKAGFTRVRFGDVTEAELEQRGLPLTEANERRVREELRRELGMAAYAILNLPRIDSALKESNVVVDGLYSWEEYLTLKERYGDSLVVIAVMASPAVRRQRLAARTHRPLSAEEVDSRDRAEIEEINKGGPIAMADITLVNEGTLDELRQRTMAAMEGL